MWRASKKYHVLWQRGFFLMDYLRDTLAEKAEQGFLQKFGDMTYRQNKVFRAVLYMTSETSHGVTLKALSRKLRISAASASEMVDLLVQKGILVRTRSNLDRRAVCIGISDPMKAEMVKIDHFYADRARRLAAVLTEKEINQLLLTFDKLYREVQEIEAGKN